MEGDILRRGRIRGVKPPEVDRYTSSIEADRWIFEADLTVDKAHVVMLVEQGIIPLKDGLAIIEKLDEIGRMGYEEVTRGSFEDIHVAIETRLIEALGEDVGGRMHTARSRNDEVATCIRFALRRQLIGLLGELLELMKVLHSRSLEYLDAIMPGYTHTQHAQPVTLAHHLTAHLDSFERDFERILDAYKRVNLSPLGAGALATTGFPINRFRTAELLGFDGLVENSMDAVSARDFILETLSCLAILATHLSRIAEELVLWSSLEFGYAELPDEYSSTSSIMPQKKNPDTMELTRAKACRVYGNLAAALSMLKALPLTYNRDLQEVTPRLWDSVETVRSMLRIVSGALKNVEFKTEAMRIRVSEGFSTATELADLLVRRRGLAFRTAHMIVGALVSEALSRGLKPEQVDGKLLDEVSVRVYGKPMNLADEEVREALTPSKCVEVRKVVGGPSPETVREALEHRRKLIERLEKKLKSLEEKEYAVERRLAEAVEKLRKQLRA